MHFDLTLWRMTAGLRGCASCFRCCSACWRWASASPASSSSGGSSPACSGARRPPCWSGRWPAPASPSCCAPRSITAAPWSRTAPPRACRRRCAAGCTTRSSRSARPGSAPSAPAASCCRWSTASSNCRRFFGQYLPQVAIAICRAAGDLRVHRLLGRARSPLVMLVAALFTLFAARDWCTHAPAAASRARQTAFKAFGEEFLDAVQGLPTLKAFGQSQAYGRMLADKARALSRQHVLGAGDQRDDPRLHRSRHRDGRRAALALGAWRVQHGEMSLTALLIVLMAGTEIFRPLRDLRTVLHQGMNGQAAAHGINALLATPDTAPARRRGRSPTAGLRPRIEFEDVALRLSRRPRRRASRAVASSSPPASASASSGPAARANRRSCAAAAAVRPASRQRADRRAGPARARSRGAAPHDRGGVAGHLSCSTARSTTICGSAGPTRPRPSWSPPPAPPTRTTSSWRCPTATRR